MSFHDVDYFELKVYAEDTDFMGIVYHANYLRFFERARTEMIRKSGLSLTTLAQYDCHFAINDVRLRYFFPARLEDQLMVASKVTNKKTCSLVFDQRLYNQDNTLLCEGLIKVVCLDETMKPRRIPENLF
ncbi:acyl-CoA thioesterase [Legionella lansingensis]|uniref:Acyl-CoA thioesterase n=1 Tax=Legionella lansingensis TaxID=45067 RepID=A0A0W0VJL4_9GAMM|nr:YbgC/FadM family acyl-CoA thioesterase [Legionella lansingensis]KTD20287.1 acyl-CoA thioesterase [Legionella lansingensis]SNV50322.1 acyl-CoA thioesterase [Legionella lansingensis]